MSNDPYRQATPPQPVYPPVPYGQPQAAPAWPPGAPAMPPLPAYPPTPASPYPAVAPAMPPFPGAGYATGQPYAPAQSYPPAPAFPAGQAYPAGQATQMPAAMPYGQPAAYGQPGVYGQPAPQNQPYAPQPSAYPQPPFPGYAAQPPAYQGQPQAYQGQPHVAVPPMPAPASLPMSAQPMPAQPAVVPVARSPQPVPAQPKPVQPRPVPAAPSQSVAAPTAPRPLPVGAGGPAVPERATAPRPVPVAARPIPVGSPNGSAAAPVVKKAEEGEEAPKDVTEVAVRKAPPWMVSLVVHMVLIIGLALAYYTMPGKDQIFVDAVWAESIGEQLLDDTLQSPESLEMNVEVPALSFDIKQVDDPLAAPPQLPDNFLEANVATDSIEAPSIGLALTGREAGAKRALLAAYGGNATTEASVRMALEWLKKQQLKDGGWSLTGPYSEGAGVENRCSATAMALLAFQGAGNTHQAGDFKNEVKKGWDYLLAMQNADGYFEHEAAHHHRLYAQAQASIAICEIYGMTKDEKFKKPAQKALDFAHKAQAPEGGWRYEPKIDADTSVTGWYVMALQSGRMAGLEVQSPAEDEINKFLDRCSTENGSRYSYKPGMETTLTMTAEGLLCRQYLGWKHDDERMRRGIDHLLGNTIDYGDQNVYYWYYATQACHHMDGDDWNKWNSVMRQAVPSAQVKTGNERGSWAPAGDRWGAHGGRLYVTCLSTYMLEVYYRHLPIYKWRLQ